MGEHVCKALSPVRPRPCPCAHFNCLSNGIENVKVIFGRVVGDVLNEKINCIIIYSYHSHCGPVSDRALAQWRGACLLANISSLILIGDNCFYLANVSVCVCLILFGPIVSRPAQCPPPPPRARLVQALLIYLPPFLLFSPTNLYVPKS